MINKAIIKAVLNSATKESKEKVLNELLNHISMSYDYNDRKAGHILEMLADNNSIITCEDVNIDYINRNLDKLITLKELAKHSNYNSNYICMMFREYLGMNFSKYLLSERMKKAKELFDTGRYSVKEVQTMVGYAEYSYFHSEFTKFYGITPAKYLKD